MKTLISIFTLVLLISCAPSKQEQLEQMLTDEVTRTRDIIDSQKYALIEQNQEKQELQNFLNNQKIKSLRDSAQKFQHKYELAKKESVIKLREYELAEERQKVEDLKVQMDLTLKAYKINMDAQKHYNDILLKSSTTNQ